MCYVLCFECKAVHHGVFVEDCSRVPTPMMWAGGVHVEYSVFIPIVMCEGFRPLEASATMVVVCHVGQKRVHLQGISPDFGDAAHALFHHGWMVDV